jgi:RNA polymerase sigma factor (TIGR02999 family)
MSGAPTIQLEEQRDYAALKRLASVLLHRHRSSGCRTTSLAHRAYLRMASATDLRHRSTRRLLALASRAMRSVLVDQARRRTAAKRGSGAAVASLADWDIPATIPDEAILDLNDLLTELRRIDARKARVVELRFFGGLTTEETAGVLDISAPTVKREWSVARAWLFKELTREPSG